MSKYKKNAPIIINSVLEAQAADIRSRSPNWAVYRHAEVITEQDYQCLIVMSKNKNIFFQREPEIAVRTMLNMLKTVTRDNLVQYILLFIDDFLLENRKHANYFYDYGQKNKVNIWEPFYIQLKRTDGFIVNISLHIVVKLASWSDDYMPQPDLNIYLNFLKDQLIKYAHSYIKEMAIVMKDGTLSEAIPQVKENYDHKHTLSASSKTSIEGYVNKLNEQQKTGDEGEYHIPANEFIQSVSRCLQMMLRIDHYRFAFVNVDGVNTLVRILTMRVNFQVQYQLIFCLWVLTFNPLLASRMNKFGVIQILSDIVNDCAKEKVVRLILAVFRNLIEKPNDPQVIKENCIVMVQCKILNHLSVLQQRRFSDEDILNDIAFLTDRLQNSVQALSSFDEYSNEVRSCNLEWSPVHKSAKFWRENASRLNEKNYELVRILVNLLETSRDATVLAVAVFDIGEYVHHCPKGRRVLDQMGGKGIVMKLLNHPDSNVRYEALLAVQKFMVQN